ncbi:MAG: PIN domain-containing protein [Candidatus Dormibacteria bacterium]
MVSEGERYWPITRPEVGATGNLVSEAPLVALTREHGVSTIWTHDRDFHMFAGVRGRDVAPPTLTR